MLKYHIKAQLNRIPLQGGGERGDAVVEALRYNRFPIISLEFFIDNSSGRTMALGSTQPLTEMSNTNISRG
jgi:hypothetical protein